MQMAETDTHVPELPTELETVDEVHLPGDEEKQKEAQAAAAQQEEVLPPPEPEEEPHGQAQAEAQTEEEEEPRSSLDQFTQLLQGGETPAAGAAPDPNVVALEEARERERKLMEARIADLKEMRAQPETPTQDSGQSRAERITAAKQALTEYLSRDDLSVEDQAAGIVEVQKELLDMEREEWTAKELSPIQDRIKQADQQAAKHHEVQQVANEMQTGLSALIDRGGTAKDLVQQFTQNGVNSYLGQALVANWNQEKEVLPPNMRSRQTVEALGIAIASEIDRALAQQGGDESAPEPTAPGVTPRKRKPTKQKPTGDEAAAEQLLEETTAHMGNAMSKLGLDKVEWRPQNR
jgi:hypothetical protein